MTESDGQFFCDKCSENVEGIYRVKIGSIMSFDLCGDCERNLELIVIDFIHGVKE